MTDYTVELVGQLKATEKPARAQIRLTIEVEAGNANEAINSALHKAREIDNERVWIAEWCLPTEMLA